MKTQMTILIFLFLPIFSGIYSQTDPVDKLNSYLTNRPQEKVYIHLDKPYYILGEILWGAVYLVDAARHAHLTPSQTVYVDLLDEDKNIKEVKTLKIENGSAALSITLDPNWSPGKYSLRAYTKYMLNFDEHLLFHKEIEIASIQTSDQVDSLPVPTSTTVLRFFPESGDLICGMKINIGVLATDEFGQGRQANCRVFDGNNQLITLFRTSENGFGNFVLDAQCDLTYNVKIDGQEDAIFSLPQAQNEGINLSIKNAHKDSLLCVIQGTADLASAKLVIHTRGQEASILEGFSGQQVAFYIDHQDLTPGINHFTIFDNNLPVAERLVYSNNGSSSYPFAIEMEKDNFGQVTPVSIRIHPIEGIDTSGQPSISISVSDYYVHSIDDNPIDILGYLLLQSDIPGGIPGGGSLLTGGEKEKRQLDQIMLTKGWRRFTWKDVMQDSLPQITFFPENGFNIEGVVELRKRKNLSKATVQMSAINESLNMFTQETDESGNFSIRGLQYEDTTTLIIGAKDKELSEEDKKARDLPIQLLNRYNYVINDTTPFPSQLDFSEESKSDYQEIMRYNQTVDSNYANLWTIDLEGVDVVGEKIDPNVEYHEKSMVYSEPDQRVMLDQFPQRYSYNNVINFLIGKIPGAQVVGSGTNRTFIIRGQSTIILDPTVKYILDGAEVSVDYVNNLPMERVAFIDVIRSLSKSVALGFGGSGVIAIYTKSVNEDGGAIKKDDSDKITIILPGYSEIREFYNPLPGESQNMAELQNRTTLYWNPKIQLDERHKGEFTFATSNQPAIYLIQLQGIAPNGQIINESATIQVN